MKHARRLFKIGMTLFLALAVTVILANWVWAAEPSTSGTTRIIMNITQFDQGDNQGIAVSAQLTDNGKPLGNDPVEFDLSANFFGVQQVNLATVQTDATGTATITYRPTAEGEYNFTARFRGDESHPQVEVTRTYTYSGPVSQYQPEAVGLTAIRQWITPVIFLGVGIFWLLLIVIAVRTLGGIRRAGLQGTTKSKSYRKFGQVVYQKRSSGN